MTPLDNLPDARIEAAILLLRMIRRGGVDVFFRGTEGFSVACDLNRAGLIYLVQDQDEHVGRYWRIVRRGVGR